MLSKKGLQREIDDLTTKIMINDGMIAVCDQQYEKANEHMAEIELYIANYKAALDKAIELRETIVDNKIVAQKTHDELVQQSKQMRAMVKVLEGLLDKMNDETNDEADMG